MAACADNVALDMRLELQKYDIGDEIRFILVGHTGVGKSSLGNTLAGTTVFKSQGGMGSTTKCSQVTTQHRFNSDLVIVDTPGFRDTVMSQEDLQKEILRVAGMARPGPHAFLLVIRLDVKYTAEQAESANQLRRIFGKDSMKYTIIVFTQLDVIAKDGASFESTLENAPKDLHDLLEECGGRHIAVDNTANADHKDQVTKRLTDMVYLMIGENYDNYFTNEGFEEIEKACVINDARGTKDVDELRAKFRTICEQSCNSPDGENNAKLEEDKRKVAADICSLKTNIAESKAKLADESSPEWKKYLAITAAIGVGIVSLFSAPLALALTTAIAKGPTVAAAAQAAVNAFANNSQPALIELTTKITKVAETANQFSVLVSQFKNSLK